MRINIPINYLYLCHHHHLLNNIDRRFILNILIIPVYDIVIVKIVIIRSLNIVNTYTDKQRYTA
jgi:hypothetical protein